MLDTTAFLAVLRWPIVERIPLVGDLALSPHGIAAAAGFLLGAMMMVRRAERRGIARTYVADIRESVQDLLFYVIIGAIVGARLFFVLGHLDLYAEDPLSVLAIWEGGLTLLGGVAGGLLAALPVIFRRGYDTVFLLDSAAPGLAAGIFVGRFGDLAIGDHLGGPAPGFPLAWRCTGNYWEAATNSLRSLGQPMPPIAGAPLGDQTQGCFAVAVHQTALYDLLQVGALMAVLLVFERRTRWNGFFTAVFVAWYGLARFAMDFVREDPRMLGLTGSQYAALVTVLALVGYLTWRRPWQNRPWSWNPPRFDVPWKQPPTTEPAAPATTTTATGPGDRSATGPQTAGQRAGRPRQDREDDLGHSPSEEPEAGQPGSGQHS